MISQCENVVKQWGAMVCRLVKNGKMSHEKNTYWEISQRRDPSSFKKALLLISVSADLRVKVKNRFLGLKFLVKMLS